MTYLDTVKDTLTQLKPHLSEKYGVSTLALFGSITRDDFTDLSDIDIMVTFDRPIGIEFIDLADELEDKFQRKVDLVTREGIKPRYFKEIEPDILYV